MLSTLRSEFRKRLSRMAQVLPTEQRFLLAVSGGMDSVVLTDLMYHAGTRIALAHANFQLRGEASDGDQAFVEHLAKKYSVPFFAERFDTLAVARERGMSVQMAARALRYDWLEKTRQAAGYTWVVTAHHAQDAIETFLLNFTRGTGLAGLTGIPPVNESVLRPMLFLDRGQIEAYYRAAEHLTYRIDASNAETKYQRNKIRHQVLPVLREINPALDRGAAQTLHHLKQAQYVLDWAVAYWRERVTEINEAGETILRISELKHEPWFPAILFDLLKPYPVTSGQVADILKAVLKGGTGPRFIGLRHEILLNRGDLLIRSQQSPSNAAFTIPEGAVTLHLPGGMLVVSEHKPPPNHLRRAPEVATLDAQQLVYPLILRRWRAGDRFQPLGMEGRSKKLKDYFTDEKWSRYDKENAWILTSGDGTICWIVGHRIDHRYRVRENTQAVQEIIYLPNQLLKPKP